MPPGDACTCCFVVLALLPRTGAADRITRRNLITFLSLVLAPCGLETEGQPAIQCRGHITRPGLLAAHLVPGCASKSLCI